MIKTLITSFKLENTYKANSIIYSIKGLPIIKDILPYSLYQSKGLKKFANIISGLVHIVNIFWGKFIYLLLMVFFMSLLYETNQANTFLHIFTFLTMIGGLLNTHMFTPANDKYYAIVIMNMDAQKYALANIYYLMIEIIIGFMPFTIILGLIANLSLAISIIMPIFVVMLKLMMINYELHCFNKTRTANIEKPLNPIMWLFAIVFLVIGYGLPFAGITISETIFIIIFGLSIIGGTVSLIKINKFKYYKKMYKQLLTLENVYKVENINSSKKIKENTEKQIKYDGEVISNKSGFAYFHELFVKRHKKILTQAVKRQAIIILVVFAIAILTAIFNSEISKNINNMMLTYLPYFVFIMYLLNRGTTVTQAMFMNCDHSMLTYKIYRTPRLILGVFKQRLKTLIILNLLPATLIAVGLPLLLYITGGTDNILNYFVLFFSIIAMSIFFSVHYLVMYYLLQPYNVATELKNSTYGIVQGLTYIVCYYMIKFKLPTIPFGITITTFSILYCLISLVVAYKLAPRTFKLRV